MVIPKTYLRSLPLLVVAFLFLFFVPLDAFARDPFPETDFSCFQKTAIEFNSLRPYEAAPCNPNRADETLMCGHDLVATRKITFPRSAPPSDPQTQITQRECRQTAGADGSTFYECDYDIQGQFRVQVDLRNAKLPIMGNTNTHTSGQEDAWVRGGIYRGASILTPAQKMNNYVSWYMNGITGRPEDPFLTKPRNYPLDPTKITNESELATYLVGYYDTRKIIDFSGPVKKLLPFRIQQRARLEQAEAGRISDADEIRAGIRHNQIAGCYFEANDKLGYASYIGQIFSKIFEEAFDFIGIHPIGHGTEYVSDDPISKIPGPCYPSVLPSIPILGQLKEDIENDLNVQLKSPIGTIMNIRRVRISNFVDGGIPGEEHPLMPEMEDYENFAEYWMDYMRWRGAMCLSTTQTGMLMYVCFDTDNWMIGDDFEVPDLDGNPNIYGLLYQYIPFTSTEDRKGLAKVDPPLADQPPSEINITHVEAQSAEFPPETDLFYPHMQEDAELVGLLQTTYVPQLEDPIGEIVPPDTIYGDTPYCEKIESRTNPGDELFPQDHVEGAGTMIDSLVNYTGNFTCSFTSSTSPECMQECITQVTPPAGVPLDQYCQAQCTSEGECEKTIVISSAVYTGTPLVDESWMRYVEGPMSIFRMIYPDITDNYSSELGVEPLTPVEEILDIPADTNATYTSDGDDTYAGYYAYQRPGERAKLYFPHIGSIYDYVLRGIQYALLPQELILPPAPGTGTPNIDFGQGGGGEGPVVPPSEPDPTLYESAACPTSVPAGLLEPENGILCRAPAACASVPDSAIPSEYLALKANAIDWATNKIFETGGENNLVSQCFNYVVKQSLDADVNPLYALTIWIQESGGSNYNSNATTCDPNCPTCTVQDMGVNNPNYAGNLEAQLRQFLRLVYIYPVDYPQCFGTGCNLASFSRVFKYGASSGSCSPSSGEPYAAKTKRNMQDKLGAPCVPKYPTDLSCP